jgi:hypothetical protein
MAQRGEGKSGGDNWSIITRNNTRRETRPSPAELIGEIVMKQPRTLERSYAEIVAAFCFCFFSLLFVLFSSSNGSFVAD